MNFWDFDPVAGIGVEIGAARCNPLVWKLRLRDMLSDEFYKRTGSISSGCTISSSWRTTVARRTTISCWCAVRCRWRPGRRSRTSRLAALRPTVPFRLERMPAMTSIERARFSLRLSRSMTSRGTGALFMPLCAGRIAPHPDPRLEALDRQLAVLAEAMTRCRSSSGGSP